MHVCQYEIELGFSIFFCKTTDHYFFYATETFLFELVVKLGVKTVKYFSPNMHSPGPRCPKRILTAN